MPRKKPLIGVTTSAGKGHLMWWCIRLGVMLAGGRAIRMTALNPKDKMRCDGYIISGGVDIDPSSYGQKNTASMDVDPARDALEKRVIKEALEGKKPLMGICRGAQLINVVHGGTLHQNAQDFFEQFIPTDNALAKIVYRQKIRMVKEGILSRLFKDSPQLSVNSLHHQAIDKLGKSLKIVAEDDLGVVQAIESDNSADIFLLGVQWHPEFMIYSALQRRLFRALVVASIGVRSK